MTYEENVRRCAEEFHNAAIMDGQDQPETLVKELYTLLARQSIKREAEIYGIAKGWPKTVSIAIAMGEPKICRRYSDFVSELQSLGLVPQNDK